MAWRFARVVVQALAVALDNVPARTLSKHELQ